MLDVAGYLTKGEIGDSPRRCATSRRTRASPPRPRASLPQHPGTRREGLLEGGRRHRRVRGGSGLGNILNFSVGANADLEVPRRSGPDWRASTEQILLAGERREASISNAVSAIDTCFREDREAQVREDSGGAGRGALEREVRQGVVRTVEEPATTRHLNEKRNKIAKENRIAIAPSRRLERLRLQYVSSPLPSGLRSPPPHKPPKTPQNTRLTASRSP